MGAEAVVCTLATHNVAVTRVVYSETSVSKCNVARGLECIAHDDTDANAAITISRHMSAENPARDGTWTSVVNSPAII